VHYVCLSGNILLHVHTFESEGKVDGERMGFREFFLLMVGSPTVVVLLLKVRNTLC